MVYVKYNRSGGGWGCLILGILGLVAGYYILKGLFYVLYVASPVLFVLALAINWRAVADTGRDFLSLLQRNPLGGLVLGALAVVGFPVLALYLFVRALGYTRMEQFSRTMRERHEAPEAEFVEFEELESRPNKDTPPVVEDVEIEPLPEPDKPARAEQEQPKPGNTYDEFFK
ncbi:MAG: DUF1206 domain-containing protein [Lewinellaceae bacterium]|nr:DUF1206 domain-containing protein [Lewinellaceae bacterium]